MLALPLLGILALAEPTGPAGVTLEWSGLEGCPDQAAFRADLERVLGRSLAASSERSVAARIRIEVGRDGRYRLALRLEEPGGTGEKTIEDDSCALLVEAAVLIVALAIDPVAVMSAGEAPEPAPPDPVVPPPASPEPSPPAKLTASTRPPMPPRVRHRGLVRLAALGGGGMLPGIAFGVELAAGWLRGSFGLEAVGRGFPPVAARAASNPAVGADLHAWSLGLRACWRPALGQAPVEVPLCGELEAGQLVGRGVAPRAERTGYAAWGGAGASLGLDVWVARRFGLFLAGEGGLALLRPAFAVAAVGDVHRPAPGYARVRLGLTVRFP